MQTQAPAAAPGTEPFLEAALSIGRRLVQSALWDGESCTWQVMTPDRANPRLRRAAATVASGTIYEGAGGIALYLAELHGVTGDADLARTALGAVRYSLNEGNRLGDSAFGFHSGRPGIAYVAARAGELLGRPELYARAEALLRPLVGHEGSDQGMDVIAGGGGGIPALLRLARYVDPHLVMEMARGLGDNLVAQAVREAEGWSWATMRNSAVRNLNGYAHGAAGIGHGLLELYAATGDGRYRYGAEQAFLYERAFFDAGRNNWPDLRHTELGEYQYEGRIDELRAILRSGGRLPGQAMRYMSAWCHGAPGIGLSRLRAWQLLGDPLYRDESLAACENVRAGEADRVMGNYSLCHGRGGNCETLIEGARILGDPSLLEQAYATAREGVERHGGDGRAPWPCGTLGSVSDPGLLLGEAGIGFFLLRLARPDVPSPLLLTAPDDAAARGGTAGEEGWRQEQDRTVAAHFGRTLQVFRALGVSPDLPLAPMGPAPRQSDVALAYEALAGHVRETADAGLRERLEDAFLVERERYGLARTVTDQTQEFLDTLARLPTDEVEWGAGRVELSPRVRIVGTRWDWDGWVEREDEGAPEDEDGVHWLLQYTGGRLNARRLSPFAAVILETVRASATLNEVIETVAAAVSGDGGQVDRGWVEDRVVEQLNQAYRAGFVNVTREPSPVPA